MLALSIKTIMACSEEQAVMVRDGTQKQNGLD